MSIVYLKKYFGYGFWVALEVFVLVGLPRLVIFPVVAYLIGKEEFGLFLFAFGIMMILGKSPSSGLVMGTIRHISEYKENEKDRFISTGLRLCQIAMIAITLIGIVVLAVIHACDFVDSKIIKCMAPLLILLYCWNLFELQMIRYRVERKFAVRTGWYSLLALFLFISIPAALYGGAVGMAWGYMSGYLLVRLILSWKQNIFFKTVPYDIEMAKVLKKVWFHLSLANVLALSSRYVYRIILGLFESFSSVTILFGATNIISLCMAPLDIFCNLLFGILGGVKQLRDIGKKQIYTVIAAAVTIGAVAPAVVFFAGPFILSIMFPRFAEQSAEILRIIILVIPFAVITGFSKQFVVKFGPIKFIPVLNLTDLFFRIIPSILLIPRYGIKGAAIAYDLGYFVSAMLWLATLIWTIRFCNKTETAGKPQVKPGHE